MNTGNIVLGLLCIAVSAGAGFAGDGPARYRQLDMAEYEDKVAGGWIGQAVGVLWGQWTEGKWQGQIVPFDLKDWHRIKPSVQTKMQSIKDRRKRAEYRNKAKNDLNNWETWQPEMMSDQDDLYIEFMFLHSIRKYGLDVTATEIARDWVKYLDKNRIWCANRGAYGNFLKGIWPPMSGHPRNTPWG
ncbi:MAG: ADP-ribosylglycohydrolase family protein, partial [Phycisphaerales bacterium]